MYLLINTAETDKITLALVKPITQGNLLLDHKTISARRQQSEKLLLNLQKLLQKNKIKLKNLKGIMAVSGPGSFTSLRIGLASANTLGYVLKIPMAEIKMSELKKANNLEEMVKQGSRKLKKQKRFKIILPYYGQEPNITQPKQ
ncbi:MAG: tRNA (adenosine(37)-N6)-threonylcarbamoyltransferase complex dimerization subunit type 1 TsaB [bacterium]